MNPDLLKLPWEIQAALASGYAAYAVAYMGLRDQQRPIDIAFLSLVFSLPATFVFWLFTPNNPIWLIAIGFVASVISGIIWRGVIRPLVFQNLRKLDVTWSNDDPSALATIGTNREFFVTQIAVLLDDGTWLRCDDVDKFKDAPYGPCLIGPNGDVALYLTHEESAAGEIKILKTVRGDPYWGDRITYVPLVSNE